MAMSPALQVSVVRSFDEVITRIENERVAAVAVDIPIGLPAAGPRGCDRAARAMLGPRRTSVFPAPVRAALRARTFEDAVRRSRKAHRKALSLQVWNIVPKIREVDAVMQPDLERTIVEAHPELSFALLAGHPMRHPKRTAAGRDERLLALGDLFPDAEAAVRQPPAGAAPDDVLDAFVLAWTARRWQLGTAVVLGDDVDATGLSMRIVA